MEVLVTKIINGTSLTNLEQLFSRHGEIQNLKIVTDCKTGELNGVALVKVKADRMTKHNSSLNEEFPDFTAAPPFC